MANIEAIEQLKERLIDWKAKFKDLTIDVARNNKEEAIDLVTENQLQKGIDGEGAKIQPAYTPFTVKIKRLKGQPTNRVTLKDEGDFYDSIDLRFGTGSTPWIFVVYATDDKVEKLQNKYGEGILGFNETSLNDFNESIKPELIKTIQNNF